MKLKYLFILVFLLLGIIIFSVFYFDFDKSFLTKLSFYLDLANPSVKIIKINEGLRKEEIAEIVGDKLFWDEKEKSDFINLHLALNTTNREGRYFPKTYLIDKDEGPKEVGNIMFSEYEKEINKIKEKKSTQIINEETILKIASIIEREAGSKSDMVLISGIIWNRIWSGMKLQMDATLQYAKGSEEEGWWGKVVPEDKNIESLYNTYMYKGLPPSPIANPGKNAIYAAYNPQKTECMFYFHDKKRKIHCSKTYEEHRDKLKIYY